MIKILLSVILVMISLPAWADTHTAASCENKAGQLDVQAAITSSETGDTVTIPSGNCTWDTMVTIPADKKIILQGSGTLGTVITTAAKALTITEGSESRVQNISWVQAESGDYVITAQGTGWVIDSCRFDGSALNGGNSGNAKGINATGITGPPAGVISRNYFNHNGIVVNGYRYGTLSNANAVWALPSALGSEDSVYVEGNTFIRTSTRNSIDSNYGASWVFRYNTSNGYLYSHGPNEENSYRGTKLWEIYNNSLVTDTGSAYTILMLSGSGVVFNNYVSGNWSQQIIGLNVPEARADDTTAHCNGDLTNPRGTLWNGNSAITAAIYGSDSSGTATANGATLTVSGKTWTPDYLIGSHVYNLNDCSGVTPYTCSKCEITDNDATTVTCSLAGGTKNTWAIGDSFLISDGYPCRDQIGRGYDNPEWVEGAANTQPLTPAYAWNNTAASGDFKFTVRAESGDTVLRSRRIIVENRDYYEATSLSDAKTKGLAAGYAPADCPHPLIGLTTKCTTAAGIGGYDQATTHTVTVSTSTGCTVTYLGANTVGDGETLAMTMTAAYGYSITATGCTLSGSTCTTAAVTGDLAVSCNPSKRMMEGIGSGSGTMTGIGTGSGTATIGN